MHPAAQGADAVNEVDQLRGVALRTVVVEGDDHVAGIFLDCLLYTSDAADE